MHTLRSVGPLRGRRPAAVAARTLGLLGSALLLGVVAMGTATIEAMAPGSSAHDERGGSAAQAWSALSPLGLARQETGSASVGPRLYVIGGLVAGGMATRSVEVLDLRTGAWSPGPGLPAARDHVAATEHDGRVWVIGGYAGNFVSQNDVWLLEPGGQWMAGPPLPEPRGAGVAASVDGVLIVVGGADRQQEARAGGWRYDPIDDDWDPIEPMPTAREHTNGAVLGRWLHVIGGRSSGVSTAAHERYDPRSDRWTVLADLPVARSAGAVAAMAGRIHFAGGETPMLFARHDIWSPQTGQWQIGLAMEVPRHGVHAIATDLGLVAAGGGTVQGLQPTAHSDVYTQARIFADGFELGDESLWSDAVVAKPLRTGGCSGECRSARAVALGRDEQ